VEGGQTLLDSVTHLPRANDRDPPIVLAVSQSRWMGQTALKDVWSPPLESVYAPARRWTGEPGLLAVGNLWREAIIVARDDRGRVLVPFLSSPETPRTTRVTIPGARSGPRDRPGPGSSSRAHPSSSRPTAVGLRVLDYGIRSSGSSVSDCSDVGHPCGTYCRLNPEKVHVRLRSRPDFASDECHIPQDVLEVRVTDLVHRGRCQTWTTGFFVLRTRLRSDRPCR